uniref:Major facilitator superfamily (MFS) profile domain-containing protein n=2 Tax=Attheya septentrionalis TaxID=420275 RepID=A0A7S2URL5_9STRA|mmetsp:Transcript_655/g.1196  ORF Transcript_655/g.1196 Transcript_655/m.1196 type:complete len:478 (+) Transcript_655:73-1506(+)
MVLPTGDGKSRRRSRPLWKDPTMILLGLTGAVDAADGRVLTALFRALESEFSFGPETLSYLLIGQSLSMAVSSPLWGYLADRKSRSTLLAIGCFICGFSTWLMAGATTFFHLLVMRSLAGIALASISPVGQSLVADLVPERNRGRVFGILMAVSNAGAFWGGLFATSYGGRRIFSPWSGNSISGWRFVLLVVGSLPLLLSIVVYLIMSEPRRTLGITKGVNSSGNEGTFHFLKRLFRVRTFQLIVLQGLFGAIPWNALSFSTLWLQHAGFDDFTASKIVSWHMIGAMFGVALGGQLGDMAAVWSPSRGRVYVAQASTLMGTLVAAFIYGIQTADPSVTRSAHYLSASFFSMGLVSSWCGSGVNRPILSEIVPPSQRASIMAWSIGLEGCSGALFGAPIVGLLAERVFGYGQNSGGGVSQANDDANALAKAMLYMVTIPWLFCFTVYGWVGHVYQDDRKSVKRSQTLGPLELENGHSL